MSISSTRVWKRYSPPSASIVSRMLMTIVTSGRCRYGDGPRSESRVERCLDEFGEDLAAKVPRVLDAAVKLAVGKGAGAAFAELRIGFRVKHAAAPQPPGVLRALPDRLSAFEDDRAKAHLRKDQGGEQPQGPAPITTGRGPA